MSKNKMNQIQKPTLSCNFLGAGIGCWEYGFKKSGLFDIDLKATAEINRESIICNAIINHNLLKHIKESPADINYDEVMKDLIGMNIGYNGKKYNWGNNPHKGEVYKHWLASFLTKNLGDLRHINFLPYADLWTINFDFKEITLASDMWDVAYGASEQTLLWQYIRLLRIAEFEKKLPKFIIFETIKIVLNNQYILPFNELLNILSDLGYNFYWQVINARDVGGVTSHERLFVVCVNQKIDKGKFKFPRSFENKMTIKDIMEYDAGNYFKEDKIKVFAETSEKRVLQSKCKVRKMTWREYWRMMGFSDNIIDKVKSDNLMTDTMMFKRICRATSIHCIDLIAQHLYKAFYEPDFKCIDELSKFVQTRRDEYGVIRLGYYSPSLYDSACVVSLKGYAPAIREAHGTIPAICENEDEVIF